MKIIKSVSEMISLSSTLPSNRCVVPTMGALHQGHVSLLNIASKSNLSIATLFVNPLQFNDKSDYLKYPNTLEEDIDIFSKNNVDILFMPDKEDIFNFHLYEKIDSGYAGNLWEGKYREGHFNGVLTIVDTIFQILKPTKAVFGMKDFQQLCMIFSYFSNKYSVEIIPAETQRNKEGLAYSSRNRLLSDSSIKRASIINKGLLEAKRIWDQNKDINNVKSELNKILQTETKLNIEYIQINPIKELAEALSMGSFDNLFKQDTNKWQILMVAGFIDEIRLIDNIILA